MENNNIKIVYTELDNRYYGLVRAAMDVEGMEAIPWIPKNFPIFDMLEELKPTMLFLNLKEVTKVIIEACNEFRDQTKTILFGRGVPQNLIPTALVAPPNTSQVIRNNIESDEYKTIYLHDSANLVDFFGGEPKSYLACDVGCVFNHREPELYPKQICSLSKIAKYFRVKIIGNEKIGLPQFLGSLEPKGVSSFYKSSKIILDYNGEQILDVAANSGYLISMVPNKLYPTMAQDILKQIEDLLKKGRTRTKTAKKAQQLIFENDTCYHRLQAVLEAADIHTEKIQERLEEKVSSCV